MRIDHREIVDMRSVIEARKRHAEYRKETARLAALALVREPEAIGSVASGQGGRMGGMGLPGTEG